MEFYKECQDCKFNEGSTCTRVIGFSVINDKAMVDSYIYADPKEDNKHGDCKYYNEPSILDSIYKFLGKK
jgi:hypothetical protein